MNPLKHAIILLTLLPCIAVAEDVVTPDPEPTVTTVIGSGNRSAMLYDSGKGDIHIIESGKPTRYYIKGDGVITDITAPEDPQPSPTVIPTHAVQTPIPMRERAIAASTPALREEKSPENDLPRSVNKISDLTKRAENGDACAQHSLALCYDAGEGVKEDKKRAAEWYAKAANQGHWWAQYMLGIHYKFGIGVIKDDSEAAKWFRKAADHGMAPAQFELGFLYDEGNGVTQNSSEAAKWYRIAAEHQIPEAQHNLACCFTYGNGVPVDLVAAYMWANIAAANGSSGSDTLRDVILAKQMTRQQIAEAQRLSREWKPSGNPYPFPPYIQKVKGPQ
jgi:uncharacterized protein